MASDITRVRGGTTDEITAPFISVLSTSCKKRILFIFVAYSSSVFEAFVAMRFVLKFQGYNFSITSAKLKYIYISLGYAALTTVLTYFVPYEGILGIIYVIFLFIISLMFTESKIITKVFVSVVTVLISLAVAAAITGSEIKINGVNKDHCSAIISKLKEAGTEFFDVHNDENSINN